MIAKIYIRSLTGIVGITAIGLYSVHTGTSEPNVLLAAMAAIVACVGLDRALSGGE